MAKYNRPNGKLFGSSATNIGVFGSGQQNETPATSTDPNTINGLGTHWEQGWDGAVVSQAPYTAPYVEDMNAVNYVNSYNSAYLLQRGIPEYSATEEYQEDSVCTYNGEIWICLQDNTVGQTPAEGIYWHLQGEVPIMNDNEILVGAVGGTPTVVDTNNQGDILASASGLDIKANTIVNADVNASAGIVESKLALDYATSTLNSDIGTVSGDLSTHTSNTSNPHSVTKAQVLSGDPIVNADVDASAGIEESKLALDYSTSSLNTAITNHTSDTANPHSTKISNLGDVTLTTPINDGDIIKYDLVSQKFVNSAPSGGGDLGYKNLTGFPVVQYKKYFDVSPNNAYWNFIGGGSYNLATQTNVTWSGSKSVNTSPLSSSTDYYFMYSASHGTIEAIKLSDCVVSSTAPAFNQATCWFNTTTKVFKYGKGASDWDTTSYDDLCVPLCMYRDGKLTHIYNEIASSFLNYLFIYPDTKYLHPKWKNQNTGEYINDVEYLSGSSNLMKDVAVNTSTYSGLDFFVRNDNNGSSFTLLKKSAIYFCEENMYYGKVVFPYNTSFTVAYSYSENAWATMWGSGTKFGDKQSYMGGGILANMDSNGIIRNIDTLDLYDRLVTKKFLNSVIEVYDIANVNSATSNIVLTSSDKRHQIFTASDGFNITLPSANIKAGEKVILEFTQDGAFTSTSMRIYAGSDAMEFAHIGNFTYIYTALVDNPSTSTDWVFSYYLQRAKIFNGSGSIQVTATQNTRVYSTTASLFTACAGAYDCRFSLAYTYGGTVGNDEPWASYVIGYLNSGSSNFTLKDNANRYLAIANTVQVPRTRSISVGQVASEQFNCMQADNLYKNLAVTITKRNLDIRVKHSTYNTGSTASPYIDYSVQFVLVRPMTLDLA